MSGWTHATWEMDTMLSFPFKFQVSVIRMNFKKLSVDLMFCLLLK
jgi:hypothetical protein